MWMDKKSPALVLGLRECCLGFVPEVFWDDGFMVIEYIVAGVFFGVVGFL